MNGIKNAHQVVTCSVDGLTKREYFAAMAMQGMVGMERYYQPETIAKHAVKCADALLSALED